MQVSIATSDMIMEELRRERETRKRLSLIRHENSEILSMEMRRFDELEREKLLQREAEDEARRLAEERRRNRIGFSMVGNVGKHAGEFSNVWKGRVSAHAVRPGFV